MLFERKLAETYKEKTCRDVDEKIHKLCKKNSRDVDGKSHKLSKKNSRDVGEKKNPAINKLFSRETNIKFEIHLFFFTGN